MKYAIVENGSNQELLREGEKVLIDNKGLESGKKFIFDKVLFLRDGDKMQTGTPYVKGSKVTSEVVSAKKGAKVVNFKKKRRKGYKRKVGHRQEYTEVLVKEIK